jgi:hypothetical protein
MKRTYVNFSVSFFGFPAFTPGEVESLRLKLLVAAEGIHKDRELEGDVTVELEESAGIAPAKTAG